MLACVREHLAPEGLFVIAIRFARPGLMANDPEEQDWFSHTDKDGRKVRVTWSFSFPLCTSPHLSCTFCPWAKRPGAAKPLSCPVKHWSCTTNTGDRVQGAEAHYATQWANLRTYK